MLLNVGSGGGAAAAPAASGGAGGAAPAGDAGAAEEKKEEKEEGMLNGPPHGVSVLLLMRIQRKKSQTRTWASDFSIRQYISDFFPLVPIPTRHLAQLRRIEA